MYVSMKAELEVCNEKCTAIRHIQVVLYMYDGHKWKHMIEYVRVDAEMCMCASAHACKILHMNICGDVYKRP